MIRSLSPSLLPLSWSPRHRPAPLSFPSLPASFLLVSLPLSSLTSPSCLHPFPLPPFPPAFHLCFIRTLLLLTGLPFFFVCVLFLVSAFLLFPLLFMPLFPIYMYSFFTSSIYLSLLGQKKKKIPHCLTTLTGFSREFPLNICLLINFKQAREDEVAYFRIIFGASHSNAAKRLVERLSLSFSYSTWAFIRRVVSKGE